MLMFEQKLNTANIVKESRALSLNIFEVRNTPYIPQDTRSFRVVE